MSCNFTVAERLVPPHIIRVSHSGLNGGLAKQGTGVSIAATATKTLNRASLE